MTFFDKNTENQNNSTKFDIAGDKQSHIVSYQLFVDGRGRVLYNEDK